METKEQLHKKIDDLRIENATLKGQLSAMILIINADDSKPNVPDLSVDWNSGGL